MKKAILLFILVFFSLEVSSKEIHHQIKINFNDKINKLNYLNYCSDILEFKGNEFIIAIVNDLELKKIQSNGLNYKIINENLEEKYAKICRKNLEIKENQMQFPSFFSFGSMGGYYTFDEAYKIFDLMKQKYPEYFVSEEVIGVSIENKEINCYIFGNKKLDKPKVLLNSLIHAREGGGLTSIAYYMWYLLENAKNGDPESLYLLNNREIYIIPVINPDGLVYNEQTNPEGGGMWRKNRRKIGDNFGVDLNRNFGPLEYWDSPNMGSSINPADVTYRGTKPFSEPETEALENFVLENDFKTALCFHTYSNDLIYPYSAIEGETADSNLFRGMAIVMSKNNKYVFGTDEFTVGYGTRGSSDDWFYYTDSLKKYKTLSITPEVGNLDDGFWTSKERILDQCIENIDNIENIIWSAESNIKPLNLKCENKFEKDESNLILNIQNIGVTDYLDYVNIWVNSIDNNYIFNSEPIQINQLLSSEISEFRIDIPPTSDAFKNGSKVKFEVVIEQNSIFRRDTFEMKLFNYQTMPLFANGLLVGNWEQGNWGFVYDENVGHFVLADSPNGLYSADDENILTLKDKIKIDVPSTLNFTAYWQIEPNYDFSKIEISNDNGLNWKNVKSSRMHSGSGNNPSKQMNREEYGFNGYYPVWVEQNIDLTDFLGDEIQIRFVMSTDKGKHLDGIFYKNIQLRKYNDVKFSDVEEKMNYDLIQNDYTIMVSSSKFSNESKFSVFNVLSENLNVNYHIINNNSILFDIEKLNHGVYFINCEIGRNSKLIKFIK